MNMKCGKSHDLDLILDYEAEQEDRRKHHKFDSTLKISIKTKKDGDSSADVSPSSSSPTLVLVDRKGIVRLYRPGAMPYRDLAAAVQSVL